MRISRTQQRLVVRVIHRLTSLALAWEMFSSGFAPRKLSRKLCLELIWITKRRIKSKFLFYQLLNMYNNLCTTVAQGEPC